MFGFQFENLVIKNRRLLLDALRIDTEDVVKQGPYFQTATTKRRGCQIDYLIQTRHSLFVVEIKFMNEPLGLDVVRPQRASVERADVQMEISRQAAMGDGGAIADKTYHEMENIPKRDRFLASENLSRNG